MTKPIQALLLAAGLGTRLKPITDELPKCLVPIGGKPLLERWLESLEEIRCERTLINTSYMAEKVNHFLDKRQRSKMNIERVYERSLMGTAGTLLANIDFFAECTGLLIHADNATNANLRDFINAHHARSKGCILTMLTFETKKPESCGIVEVDENGIVERFHEKVQNPPGSRANGAIYAFDEEFLNCLKKLDSDLTDFSTEVIPQYLGRIQTWHTKEKFIDIGTPESLQEAQIFWKQNLPTNYGKR